MGEFPLAMSESKRQRSLVNIFGANQAQTSPILRLWLKIQPMANILLYGGKPSGQGVDNAWVPDLTFLPWKMVIQIRITD